VTPDDIEQKDSAGAPTFREVALFFLKLGTTAFGGPAAHIAMMEDQLVTKRQWIDRARFMDLLAVANLIPGPSSTELAIYIGYDLLGFQGLLLAGVCFILPAFAMVLVIAAVYKTYGTLPAIAGILYGVNPVLIPILAQAGYRLGKTSLKSKTLIAIGVITLALRIMNFDPLIVLFGSGALALMLWMVTQRSDTALAEAGPLIAASGGGVVAAIATPMGLGSIFLVFLKAGAIVFGSGYVLFPFLSADLVEKRHWLTQPQLLTAIAVGQVTPGPVFTTATFIGYLLMDVPGGIVATVGIFLPAFVLVWLTGPIVRRLRQWPAAGAFLDGLNVGAIVLLAVVTFQLGRGAIVDIVTIIIALVSAVLLFAWNINTTWLVLGGGLIGLLFQLLVFKA
jgi:chromate transporter